MDPDLLVIFGSLGLTGITVAALSLVGLRIWVNRIPQQDTEKLVETLREELRGSVQDEVAHALEGRERELEDLHERLDFAERLLTQARLPKRAEGDTTPGV